MTEEFLQFVWEQRLFDTTCLYTLKGEKVEILETGIRNDNAGPDFFNARIRLGETLWAGNVEIHIHSSDWYKHGHQNDRTYDNIILHVVQKQDKPVFRADGEAIPTLELRYPERLGENYRKLMEAKSWIPCQEKFSQTDRFTLKIGFNRLMIERLQEKTGEITDRHTRNNHNWNETFYQILARNFGFKTNALPFEMVARAMPSSIPGKHRNNLHQLEALFFGQSGLLHEELLGDDYFLELRREYDFLAKKYDLHPLSGHIWKFHRMRPVNFPTLRIAQFAALFHHSEALFSYVTGTSDIREIRKLFQVAASPYWNTHFRFNLPSPEQEKHLGNEATDNLIINTLVPFIFVYGDQTHADHLKDRALMWLDKIPAEGNSVISRWAALGAIPESAFESQALLQLKNKYCDKRRCLECHIGAKLVKSLE